MPNQYTIRSAAYTRRQAIMWRIRSDYEAAKIEREEILESSPAPPDGMPGAHHITNPTLDKAVRLALLDGFITAVESGMAVVPEEYRRGVWGRVMYGAPYPIDAAVSTYERWRRQYLNAVASRL